MFGEDNPEGRIEVVTKPPLGKCSINIQGVPIVFSVVY
jgi:hypothetical protein